MRTFKLSDDEAELIGAFRVLTRTQRMLLLAAVIGTASHGYAARVDRALDNVVPLHRSPLD